MKRALFINGNRNGYNPNQCGKTFTIAELIQELEEIAEEVGEDAPVYLRNDSGYTYGNITFGDLNRGAFDNDKSRVLEDWEDYSDIENEEEG